MIFNRFWLLFSIDSEWDFNNFEHMFDSFSMDFDWILKWRFSLCSMYFDWNFMDFEFAFDEFSINFQWISN